MCGYVERLAERIAEYRPRWLEGMRDARPHRTAIAACGTGSPFPWPGAEHEYTRWGFKRFSSTAGALDVLQPDIYWCGGLSETLKIAAYATAHDLVVIPHGHSSGATIHFSVIQSPIHTPMQEYLVKWNSIHQHFLLTPVLPQAGAIHAPSEPGLGMELDAGKIETEHEVFGPE